MLYDRKRLETAWIQRIGNSSAFCQATAAVLRWPRGRRPMCRAATGQNRNGGLSSSAPSSLYGTPEPDVEEHDAGAS